MNKDVYEIDLSRVWELFKKIYKRCLLIFIVFTIVSVVGAVYLSKYRSANETYFVTSKIMVVQESYKTDTQPEPLFDYEISKQFASTYSDIINSNYVINDIINELNGKITIEEYRKMVTVKATNTSINISTSANDLDLCLEIANAIVASAKTKIKEVMKTENFIVLDNAILNDSTTNNQSSLKFLLSGPLAGILLSIIWLIYLIITDVNIRTEEQVNEIFDYPVLGIINKYPNYTKEMK